MIEAIIFLGLIGILGGSVIFAALYEPPPPSRDQVSAAMCTAARRPMTAAPRSARRVVLKPVERVTFRSASPLVTEFFQRDVMETIENENGDKAGT